MKIGCVTGPDRPCGADTSPPPGSGAGDVSTSASPGLPRLGRPWRVEPPRYLTAADLSAVGPLGPVFEGVWMAADRKDLVVVEGESGSGRTSLLLALTGRFRRTAGTVLFRGRPEPKFARDRSTVAAASPAVEVDDNHTVGDVISETVMVGAATRTDVAAGLALTGATAAATTSIAVLPRVERTLLVLGCAVAQATPVVALDDADAGLGVDAAARVWSALRRVAEADRLVLAATTRAPPDVDVTVPLGKSGVAEDPASPRDTAIDLKAVAE